ncbi:M15 family metallopeptidase domain-containing protein [Kinneretia aquatilis]|uniref:hypothetical protein n=1 Tax=Kinneretia aquatilis TaxID=2070761 RepID=UPI001495334B|nr:hypothetical protein [Paucibacter aquatile]WIV97480.1 hypothetical protein K9V56_021085 [Paucibacter aquatile]
MKEADRQLRNKTRMEELYPTFAARLHRVIQRLEDQGLRPRIQDAWRSPEDQLKAYNSGHSKLRFGFHNVTGKNGKKEALAVDLLDDDAPLSPGKPYILRLAAAAESEGLTTGVRWGLVKKMRSAIDTAIATQNWGVDLKVGWDPLHVEPIGLSVDEAEAGKRPT